MPLLKAFHYGALALLAALPAFATDEPKQTPENTVSIEITQPVKPQKFSQPTTFYVDKIIDRSGNAQPMLVWKQRGGIFLDKEPAAIVRTALEASLKDAALMASTKDDAQYVLEVYLFHFGLAEGTGLEFYGKVDLNVVVKNVKTGKSQQITALGTSVKGLAVRKKNIMKNVKDDIESALQDALRNFLRGEKLRDVVVADALSVPAG